MRKVSTPRRPVITFAEQCDQGKVRQENQDNVLHVRFALGELFIVADGMGGYEGGATASRMVVKGFHEYLASLPEAYPPDQAIREASARVNASILAAASAPESHYSHMGSTVVLALIQQNATGTQAWIGHIGDSRAYLARGGQMKRITNDHSAVQALLDRNLITPEEALTHPDASVLTRCLGHEPEVAIDIDMISMNEGDSLLLCSDGLWGFVPEAEIELAAANPQFTVEGGAQTLLELALAAGGHDNIGIELVRLNPAPVAPKSCSHLRFGFVEILALCLLVVVAGGALLYFGLRRPFIQSRLPRHPLSAAAVSLPSLKLNFAVVRGPHSGPFDVSALAVPGWKLGEVPAEKQVSCRSFVGQAGTLIVLSSDRQRIGDFLSPLHKLTNRIELRQMDERQIKQQCGPFGAIVFIPDLAQEASGEQRKPESQKTQDRRGKSAVAEAPHNKPEPAVQPSLPSKPPQTKAEGTAVPVAPPGPKAQ